MGELPLINLTFKLIQRGCHHLRSHSKLPAYAVEWLLSSLPGAVAESSEVPEILYNLVLVTN